MRAVSSFVLVGGLVLAAATARSEEPLTEPDFLDGLRTDYPAFRAFGEDLARAEAARRRAVTLANPRLELSREQPDDSPRQDTWTAAWTPPLDGRRSLARDAAEAAVLAARERATAERARLRRDLRRAYADWSLAHERREILARQLAMVEDLAGKARRRAEAGEESGFAAGRMALAAQEVRKQLVVARTEHVRAEAAARTASTRPPWFLDAGRDRGGAGKGAGGSSSPIMVSRPAATSKAGASCTWRGRSRTWLARWAYTRAVRP